MASHFKVIESAAEYEAALEAGLLYVNTSVSYPREASWMPRTDPLWLGGTQWRDFQRLSDYTKTLYCKEDLAVLVECDTTEDGTQCG